MALIALGVTGGIGAYKAVEVARGLQKRGHEVVALMTRNARRFVGEVTFEAITRRRVITGQWTPGANADIEHIAIASDIACCWSCPPPRTPLASSRTASPTTSCRRSTWQPRAPVLLAPAMNTNMLAHPAVQQNLQTLASRGRAVCRPRRRLPGLRLDRQGAARGSRRHRRRGRGGAGARATRCWASTIVVTAGPTFEDLDPVRFIGNRSSGRMGYAIAGELARRGAAVTLITGPTAIDLPAVASVIRVRSAAQMHRAVLDGRAAGRCAGDGGRRCQLRP